LLPPEWGLVTPQAPHAGHPWGYGPGWAWYKYVEEDRLVEETLVHSLSALEVFLDQLPVLLDFEPGRIVLGGFSQGGTTSMALAISRPSRVAAVLNFSGFLAESVEVPFSALSPGAPPIFWGHGLRDPNIPHELAVKGRLRLDAAGMQVTPHDYGIGHWIAPEEVGNAVAFVESL
jgi:phospholipase/carboxylesterase